MEEFEFHIPLAPDYVRETSDRAEAKMESGFDAERVVV